MATASIGAPLVPRRRFLGRPIPAEGANGLFTQSWFPLCLSSQVARGQVRGVDFLDGRVVIFRGENGRAQVLSAYCPHVGADLSVVRYSAIPFAALFITGSTTNAACASKRVLATRHHPAPVCFTFPQPKNMA